MLIFPLDNLLNVLLAIKEYWISTEESLLIKNMNSLIFRNVLQRKCWLAWINTHREQECGADFNWEVWRFLCIDSFADICCHVLCFIWNSAVGITFIQFANNNSLRNIYVLGLSLFLGISIPQYFVSNSSPNGVGPVKTDGGWFDDILNTIFSSSPTMAIIVGTLLDNTLDAKYAVDNRGLAWWRPFQSRKGDVRNEEFYSLPVRIREYIPTRFLY
nr:nucleobase-ascorbate transporter 3-like isoform X1 [Malus domestica]